MSRPAIVMHHRDLGVIVAPLLLISIVTGTMMIFRPFAMAMIAPFGPPAEAVKAIEPPKYKGGPRTEKPDYTAMMIEARRRIPDAKCPILNLTPKAGETLCTNMRKYAERLTKGRSRPGDESATANDPARSTRHGKGQE